MFGLNKHRFSLASGALACLASVLGKVAFDGDTAFHTTARQKCEDHLDGSSACSAVGLIVQAASLAGMILVNTLMLSTYLRALQQSGSTVATVTNSATNFVLSGVSGRILFGERLPGLWFCGAACIMSGVTFIAGTSTRESDGGRKDESKRKQA